MTDKPYVFIDPTGVGEDRGYFYLLVEAPTGVIYGHQCGGYLCEQKEMEGYLIPVEGPEISKRYMKFYEQYGGYPLDSRDPGFDEYVQKLAALVEEAPGYQPLRDEDKSANIKLDMDFLHDTTEAWIRVTTEMGKGVLIFPNSD